MANFGLDNSSYRAPPHSIIVKYLMIPIIQILRNVLSLTYLDAGLLA
jgi:hypothetical protein